MVPMHTTTPTQGPTLPTSGAVDDLVFRDVLGKASPEESAALRQPDTLEWWRDELMKSGEEALSRIHRIREDLRETNQVIFADGPTPAAKTRWHHTENILNRRLHFWQRYRMLAHQQLRECKELLRQRNIQRHAEAVARSKFGSSATAAKREGKEWYGLGYQEGWWQAVHAMAQLMERGTTRKDAAARCLAFVESAIRPWVTDGAQGLPPTLRKTLRELNAALDEAA